MKKLFLFILPLLACVSTKAQTSSITTFSTTSDDVHGPLVRDANGRVYTSTSSSNGSRLICMDQQADIVWTIEDSFWTPSDFKIANKHLYVTGSFTTGWDTGTADAQAKGLTDIFIAKYDLAGKMLWMRSSGGTGYEYGRFIQVDANGGIYVAGIYTTNIVIGGTSFGHMGEGDIFLCKYDNDGNKAWAKRIANPLIDELHGMDWIEKKKILLFNAYIQSSVNLGNNLLTDNNTHVTVAYDENGNPQKLMKGFAYMDYLGTDTASESIYMHSGTNYYDTTGTLYSYNYDFDLQFSMKIRKGKKSIVFSGQKTYIFGHTPVIINNLVRQAGYLDRYDAAWANTSSHFLGANVRINSGLINNGIFWGEGTYSDIADLYGHQVICAPDDQDVFLLRLDSKTLGIPAAQTGSGMPGLFPNPGSQFISMTGFGHAFNDDMHVSALGMDGRIYVCEINLHSQYPAFDASHLPAGIYQVQVRHNNQLTSIPFLKQ